MFPIPPDVFGQRLRKWRTMPDRKTVITRDERGRPVQEWWATGVCRLRIVRYPDGAELWADRGVPGYPPRNPFEPGKIAFKYFGWAGP